MSQVNRLTSRRRRARVRRYKRTIRYYAPDWAVPARRDFATHDHYEDALMYLAFWATAKGER